MKELPERLRFQAEDSKDPDWDNQPKITIREANALLLERLGETLVVFSHGGVFWFKQGMGPSYDQPAILAAILCCIEPVKREGERDG